MVKNHLHYEILFLGAHKAILFHVEACCQGILKGLLYVLESLHHYHLERGELVQLIGNLHGGSSLVGAGSPVGSGSLCDILLLC